MKSVRITLGTLLLLCAVNAVGGGWYGITGAPGVPVEWLAGSPFQSYLVPSLILMGAVGGSHALAAFWVFTHRRNASTVATAAGLILLLWIGAQLSIIGYVSWLQPTMGVTALLILGLAALLRRTDHAIAPTPPATTSRSR